VKSLLERWFFYMLNCSSFIQDWLLWLFPFYITCLSQPGSYYGNIRSQVQTITEHHFMTCLLIIHIYVMMTQWCIICKNKDTSGFISNRSTVFIRICTSMIHNHRSVLCEVFAEVSSTVMLPSLLYIINYKFMLDISETFCKGSWISDTFLGHLLWMWLASDEYKMITDHWPKLNQKWHMYGALNRSSTILFQVSGPSRFWESKCRVPYCSKQPNQSITRLELNDFIIF
jgi:hypothetical protein